ncbi:MAG: hypothetical protein KME55_42030 [Nostoc indistinguendum CM1-VF10]|jgi:hypothetical protein|nr:hypothetical protein [Nostoc indistinguendum CM1-VF10]
MNNLKQKRNRGVILTIEGLKILKEARINLENKQTFGEKYTLEELCGFTGLDIHTIKKVLICKQKIDKRTIERFFTAFNLELKENYYTSRLVNKRQDWGEAICISNFYGRLEELDKLEQWLVKDRCRLVTILGMGGTGKTSLSIKSATQVQEHFDCIIIIWRSLRSAPLVKDILANLIQSLNGTEETEINLPKTLSSRISLLINYLRKHRCLLVLDNVETLLNSNGRSGQYWQEYDGYGEFFKRIGESSHQSCLLLTSREKPKEVAFMEGELLPVPTMQLMLFSDQVKYSIANFRCLLIK